MHPSPETGPPHLTLHHHNSQVLPFLILFWPFFYFFFFLISPLCLGFWFGFQLKTHESYSNRADGLSGKIDCDLLLGCLEGMVVFDGSVFSVDFHHTRAAKAAHDRHININITCISLSSLAPPHHHNHHHLHHSHCHIFLYMKRGFGVFWFCTQCCFMIWVSQENVQESCNAKGL